MKMDFTEEDKLKVRKLALDLGASADDANKILDWKIVDSDWNLADCIKIKHNMLERIGSKDIKKCRDLILEDLKNHLLAYPSNVYDIKYMI